MAQPDNATPYQAAEYDRNVRQTIPFYETIHQETIDLVSTVRPDVRCWLDTGCGTGYLVELALPLFPTTQFVLVDPSEAMLRQARERLKAAPGDRVRFLDPVASEGLSAHCGGLTVQVVTAILCHHYLQPDKRPAAVAACYRVLEDDGLFITVENIEPVTERGTRIGLERWKRRQVGQGWPPEAVEAHQRRFKTRYFPIPILEHLDVLKAAGFRVVEAFWLAQMQAGFYAIK